MHLQMILFPLIIVVVVALLVIHLTRRLIMILH